MAGVMASIPVSDWESVAAAQAVIDMSAAMDKAKILDSRREAEIAAAFYSVQVEGSDEER